MFSSINRYFFNNNYIKINKIYVKRYLTTTTTSNIKWDGSWSVKELLLNNKHHDKNNEISKERLIQLSKLSMIEIPENKIEEYQRDLQGLLNAVDSIQSVDTSSVRPLHSILENTPLTLHKEQTTINQDHLSILQHATDIQGGFYAVPKQISSHTNKNNKNIEIHNDEF